MAYLNFSEAGFVAAVRSDRAAPAATSSVFSALEWLVIALAQRDHVSSLREPGRFARAAAALFGGRGERPLAGPRLETLRRVAVLARNRGGDVPPAELNAFRRAGFSAEQAAALIASVSSPKSRSVA